MSRVFTVKDEQGSTADGSFEQLRREKLLVIVVDRTLNVATVILILEAAVNDHFVVKFVVELAVENVKHGVFGDARNGVSGVIGEKVRHNGFISFLDIHDRLERRWDRVESRGLGIHDIIGVLKHAQGATKLFAGSQEWVRLAPGVAGERRPEARAVAVGRDELGAGTQPKRDGGAGAVGRDCSRIRRG